MKTVSVHASRSYEIRIGRGLLQGAGEQIRAVTDAKKVMLVSDDAVWPLYGGAVRRSLETAGLTVCSFVFPHGESSKCACTYLELLDALCAQQLTRKDAIAALGGGVAGDLAGFAAGEKPGRDVLSALARALRPGLPDNAAGGYLPGWLRGGHQVRRSGERAVL